jgi:hypothetical protein
MIFVCLSSIPVVAPRRGCVRAILVPAPVEGRSVSDRRDRCLAWISVALQSCTRTRAYGRSILCALFQQRLEWRTKLSAKGLGITGSVLVNPLCRVTSARPSSSPPRRRRRRLAEVESYTAANASAQRSRVRLTSSSPCAVERYQIPRPLSQIPAAINRSTSLRYASLSRRARSRNS